MEAEMLDEDHHTWESSPQSNRIFVELRQYSRLPVPCKKASEPVERYAIRRNLLCSTLVQATFVRCCQETVPRTLRRSITLAP